MALLPQRSACPGRARDDKRLPQCRRRLQRLHPLGLENPNTSPDGTNNIHNDSWLTDTYKSFESPFDDFSAALTNFGGGYFYQDEQYQMVVAFPDGQVRMMRRVDSPLSDVDAYVAVRDINVTGQGGAVQNPPGFTSISLYALTPDWAGNIWRCLLTFPA